MRPALKLLLSITGILATTTTLPACSESEADSTEQSEDALSERTADRGEIAYGSTKQDNYISDYIPSWRFRGRQGDIIEATLDGAPIGSHDLRNSDYALELLLQDMGRNPLADSSAAVSRQRIDSISLRFRLPYSGNYFVLARNKTGDRVAVTMKLTLLANAGETFEVAGKGTQKNISLARTPDCSPIEGASASLPAQDLTQPLSVAMDGTVSVVPPTVGRCSPQTFPALANPVSDAIELTTEDPSPPWQIACDGPKPLTYKLEIVPQRGRPAYPGHRVDDTVKVRATCEDLAGRTEYTFTGVLPPGVL